MDTNDRSIDGMNERLDARMGGRSDDRAGTDLGTAGRHAADDLREVGNPGDEVGEAVGGISGVLTGAALGSLGGPVGTIIGGIAGAVSGWWAGRAISDAASHASDEDEAYYRSHYDTGTPGAMGVGSSASPASPAAASGGALGTATGASSGMGVAEPTGAAPMGAGAMGAGAMGGGRSYEDVRPAYQIGHLAGRNPDYQGRSFEDVEADLRRGWTPEVSARYGRWDEVRDYARSAYDRSRAGGAAAR